MEYTKTIKNFLLSGLITGLFVFLSLCPFISAYATPDDLETQLDEASRDYYDALIEQETAQAQVNEAQTRLDFYTAKIPQLEGEVNNHLKYMYINNQHMLFDLFLSCDSIDNLFSTLDLLDVWNQRDTKLIKEYTEAKSKIEEEKAIVDEKLTVLKEQTEKAHKAYEKAQQLVNEAKNKAGEEAHTGGTGGGVFLPANTGNEVADRALREQGKPYIWGACGPKGFDCSGLVSYAICGQYGNRLGTTTTFMGWPQLSEPEIGCICVNPKHTGIYVGNGMMCHAPTEGAVISCCSVPSNMIFVRYPG